ncbi:MAG: LOG family protein [Chlorobiota bacterium]
MEINKNILKAYENSEFMNGREARTLRILSEYFHPQAVLKKNRIYNTVVFFGSARSISTEDYKKRYTELEKKQSEGIDVSRDLQILKRLKFTSKYYDDSVELAKKFSNWSKTLPTDKKLYVCTGGGPGMMEAANKGAYEADFQNIGFNIELPFEQYPNPYITPELNFEFHYFFTRKFWFVYHAKAIVVMPGGFGTLDELMEMLTLEQTNVISKKIPIVLFGSDYWNRLLDFDFLVEIGMISEADLDLFKIIDDIDEAFEYLKNGISKLIRL